MSETTKAGAPILEGPGDFTLVYNLVGENLDGSGWPERERPAQEAAMVARLSAEVSRLKKEGEPDPIGVIIRRALRERFPEPDPVSASLPGASASPATPSATA